MAPLIDLRDIAAGLALGDHSLVALVGGGGKTSVMHALGRTLRGSTVLTTTVKMGADQQDGHPVLIDPSDRDVITAAATEPVVVWSRVEGQKAIGVDPARCDAWFTAVDHVVVEADGSRQSPFKAPANFEPVMPRTTTVVTSLIGIDAIDRVIADRCHRPMRVAALAGVRPYDRLTVDGAAKVLRHERGQRRSVPPGARFVVVVTKVDAASMGWFVELADELERGGVEVIGIRHLSEC
jgi:molybdenum cofactor cytidylyltransferase